MINFNDESIVNINKTEVSEFSYVATFRNTIFYTNGDSVSCIDFQGNTQWVFRDDVLKGSFGISIDGDGNAYVVGCEINNVVVISPNGQNYKELLTSANGLIVPGVIHIDRPNYRMLVSNGYRTQLIYNLK